MVGCFNESWFFCFPVEVEQFSLILNFFCVPKFPDSVFQMSGHPAFTAKRCVHVFWKVVMSKKSVVP